MPKKELTLESINSRLKVAKVGLSVIQRGGKLSLRGTLPPKPGSDRDRPFQQTISLDVYANAAGLEYAEGKALEIGAQLAQKKFSWLSLDLGQGRSPSDTCEFWVEAFRKYALQNLIEAEGELGDRVWKSDWYYPAFKKLEPQAKFNEAAIVAAVQKTKPNTRIRQIVCQKLRKLAEFAGIEINLKPYLGNYSTRNIKRNIPTDNEIEKSIDSIPKKEWRWVAGMMAAYGLRDHECWFCELVRVEKGDRYVWVCRVSDETKTGSREALPLPGDWVDRWKLWEVFRPTLQVQLNKDYGERCSRAFRRYKVPFTPYALRHAFAIRAALKYNFPVAVSAKWLGHTPNVYLATYQRHITSAQAMDAFFDRT